MVLGKHCKFALRTHCHKSVPILIWPYMLLGRVGCWRGITCYSMCRCQKYKPALRVSSFCIILNIYIYVCIYVYIYMSVYMYIYECVCIYIWVYICMYIYIYIYMSVCIYIYTHTYIYIYTTMSVCVYTHTHTHTHTHSETSLTDHLHRSITPLYRWLYFGPKR